MQSEPNGSSLTFIEQATEISLLSEDSLLSYYRKRAEEYELIYQKPERQKDLARLRDWLMGEMRDRDVLEVACGTGYWTEHVARVARSVTATDASGEVLDVARQKSYPDGQVQFVVADAFSLAGVPGTFTAALAAFWFSHVARCDQARFLKALHGRLERGSAVVLLDNRYVEGSSTPISRRDADGNTYQLRMLRDGSAHEVLKNFPTASELERLFEPVVEHLSITEFDYFWALRYDLPGGPSRRAFG